MIQKNITFDVQVKVWQRCQITLECPDEETDEQTFARLRVNGIPEDADYQDTETFDETETAVRDHELDTPHTMDFESDELLGVTGTEKLDPEPEENENGPGFDYDPRC